MFNVLFQHQKHDVQSAAHCFLQSIIRSLATHMKFFVYSLFIRSLRTLRLCLSLSVCGKSIYVGVKPFLTYV